MWEVAWRKSVKPNVVRQVGYAVYHTQSCLPTPFQTQGRALRRGCRSPLTIVLGFGIDEGLIVRAPVSVWNHEPLASRDIQESTQSVIFCKHLPLSTSYILAVWSHDIDTQASADTCRASHILVWLYDADANQVESCEKATDLTDLLWPSSVCRHAPLIASQILIVRSYDADASRVELCEKATDVRYRLWPLSVCRHAPLLESQILTV